MIVGAGGIGQVVARLCKAFNIKVVGVDPKFEKLNNFDKVIKPEDLINSLDDIDVLVSTVMHTPETGNMFNLDLFKKMKSTSVFINVGRGKTTSILSRYCVCVNEKVYSRFESGAGVLERTPPVPVNDLVFALENNILSGAGLDVFEEEPLPKDHKLWDMQGVIITPHVALLDANDMITNRRYEIIKKNVELFNQGKELHNIVDKEKWY